MKRNTMATKKYVNFLLGEVPLFIDIFLHSFHRQIFPRLSFYAVRPIGSRFGSKKAEWLAWRQHCGDRSLTLFDRFISSGFSFSYLRCLN